MREHLGIHAFGTNAFTPAEDGTLINEHDENGTGQEELYIVLEGKATFEIDGRDSRRARGNIRVRRAGVAAESNRRRDRPRCSAPHQARRTRRIDWGEAWPFHSESMNAYSEQRYADALEAVRGGLGHVPDQPGPALQLRVLRDPRGHH